MNEKDKTSLNSVPVQNPWQGILAGNPSDWTTIEAGNAQNNLKAEETAKLLEQERRQALEEERAQQIEELKQQALAQNQEMARNINRIDEQLAQYTQEENNLLDEIKATEQAIAALDVTNAEQEQFEQISRNSENMAKYIELETINEAVAENNEQENQLNLEQVAASQAIVENAEQENQELTAEQATINQELAENIQQDELLNQQQSQIQSEINAINASIESLSPVASVDSKTPSASEAKTEVAESKDKQDAVVTPNQPPLVVINADFTDDMRDLAHDLAEQTLNAETAKSKFIKRLWKGTLFKKYYEKKYTKEFIDGVRTAEDGRTVQEIIRDQSHSAIERFVLGATEDMHYIHERIGKKNKDNTYDAGETLEKSFDKQFNAKIKLAIKDYASRRLEAGEKVSDLDREFEDQIQRIIAETRDNNEVGGKSKNNSKDNLKINNYLDVAKEAAKRYQEVAINARSKAEQEAAMAQVMAGFKVYNARVRDNIRTEAHRDTIDKIVNKLESSKIGQFIPAEILAGAAGVVAALTQTGARAIFGAAGGIVASSAIAGLKERNRITEDRARMLRDIANGMEYGTKANPDELKGAAKRTAKYEARIGGTIYDMQKASDLTAGIENALNSEGENRRENILRAIAEARVRIDYSDHAEKDLIAYSSSDKRGDERLKLDIAVIRAEKSLSEDDKKALSAMKKAIRNNIVNGYEDESGEHHAGVAEKDRDFRKTRALLAMKKAGKSLALGAAVYFGSQELMAAIDPAKIGIFEKAGLLKTNNNVDAKETLLASGFGKLRGSYERVLTEGSIEQTGEITDPEAIKHYEDLGYEKTEVNPGHFEMKETLTEVDPSESASRIDVKYDGWADNGTKFADGNELRAQIIDGKFVSSMEGSSTFNGQTINYDPSIVKGYLTIGDAKFEIESSFNEAGQLTWGNNGVFTTTGGETIKAIGDNGEKLYKYFEIAVNNGVDPNGVQHIIPLATDVGLDNFSGKIQQVFEDTIEEPASYIFTKVIPGTSETVIRDVTYGGLAFSPELGRTGLGATTAAPSTPETAPAAPESTSVASETTPNNPASTPETVPTTAETGETAPATAESAETAPTATENAPETTSEPAEAPSPAEAPENTANAQEEVPGASPELSDYENWSNQVRTAIAENAELLGGVEGIHNITNRDPYNSAEDDARYQTWWDNLSEDGKNFVRTLMSQLDTSDYINSLDWGNSFRVWFAQNNA